MRRIPVRAAAVDESTAEPVAGRGLLLLARHRLDLFRGGRPRARGRALQPDPLARLRVPLQRADARPGGSAGGETARLLDLPMTVVRSDVPKALVGIVDFNDATSAMLAAVALSLPGLAGRMLIPSATGYGDLVPAGEHPLLDPLWSTERVEVEHDLCPLREDKVDWLVRNRPDLLPLIHVCMEQDSNENCGRCGKCVWAMVLLYLAGGLERSSFPSRMDPDLVKKAYRGMPHQLSGSERVYKQLGDSREDRALKRALLHGMRASTREPMAKGSLGMIPMFSRRTHQLLHGQLSDVPTKVRARPAPRPARSIRPGRRPATCRAGCSASCGRWTTMPAATATGAGALPAGDRSGSWARCSRSSPRTACRSCSTRRVVRCCPARRQRGPFLRRPAGSRRRSSGGPSASGRADAVGGAAREGRRRARRGETPDAPKTGRRSGGTRGRPQRDLQGDGRIALFAAGHPVLDDVLLTTDPDEARELGYGEPRNSAISNRSRPSPASPGPPRCRSRGRAGGVGADDQDASDLGARDAPERHVARGRRSPATRGRARTARRDPPGRPRGQPARLLGATGRHRPEQRSASSGS